MRKKRGISMLIEAVVVAIMVIAAFGIASYYIIPSNPRLQRSQTDLRQLGFNILSSLASTNQFDNVIIKGNILQSFYSNCTQTKPSVSVTPGSAWSNPGRSVIYNITVVNNDNFCGVEQFGISVNLPSSAWKAQVFNPILTLRSGGGAAWTLLNVTSPSSIRSTGSYSINVTVSNLAKIPNAISPANSFVATYNINSASPCIYSTPSLAVSPAIAQAPAGSNISYSITVTNNDSNCGIETFSLSALPPMGWSITFSSSLLQIYSNGSSAGATMYVASDPNANASSYALKVSVVNLANPSSFAIGGANYTVISSSPSTCQRNNPSLSIAPASMKVPSGTNVSYSVSINNNDIGCGNELFSISLQNPGSGWTTILSSSKVIVSSNSSAGLTLYVSSPFNALSNTYTIQLQTNNSVSSSAYYISTGSVPCMYSKPSVVISPPSIWALNGSSISYKVYITNNDLGACGTGKEVFQLQAILPSSLWSISIAKNITVTVGQINSTILTITSPSTVASGSYLFAIKAIDQSNTANNSTGSAIYWVQPTCEYVSLYCLKQIGALAQNWQRNLDVALASIVPIGYVYNLTVYFVYVPPGQPYNVTLIPLNDNIPITNGVPDAFKNSAQVSDVTYIYTTPKLYVLLFDLQLAQVTSP